MPLTVNFPKAGMGIDEGTIARWLKRVGDHVEKGEPLVEVETAKAIQEVLAPSHGMLAKILAFEGEVVMVNTPLAIIE